MKDLISKLDAVQHLSPDEIVRYITTPTLFDIRTYKPWICPEHLRGRHVLIQWFSEFENINHGSWWRRCGQGSSLDREEGVEWSIESAFEHFRGDHNNNYYYVILHLLEPGHAQIPSPDTGRISYPWS